MTIALLCLAAPGAVSAAATPCKAPLTQDIPARPTQALPGSEVMKQLGEAAGPERDRAIVREVLHGNVPSFLHHLVPVTLTGTRASGQGVDITLCVAPEYLSVGSDRDYVRVPLGLSAAALVASELGFFLPTTKMVDAIYRQAAVHLAPSPMKPTSQMTTTSYLVTHNQTVEKQLAAQKHARTDLSAGQKKDLVLSNRLKSNPGRVAIYGWHRPNGKPIQPLSTVHGAAYADYSHGVRLISRTAFVDGKPMALDRIMRDRDLSQIVSSEGPIEDADGLLRGYVRQASN